MHNINRLLKLKIISALTCIVILLTPVISYANIKNVSHFLEKSLNGVVDWSQFRGNALSPATTDSKTPINKNQTTEIFKKQISNKSPIVINDNIYIAEKSTLYILSKINGEIKKQVQLQESIGFFSQIAYGDGKILVPLSSGRIQAFDENTLSPLFITPELIDKSLQGVSPIIYNNGYAYIGLSDSSAQNGMFYAISTSDDDTSRSNEIKNYAFTHIPELGPKGYYWSGAAITEKSVIFAGENGQVVSHNLTNANVIDTINIGEAVRSTIHYDKQLQKIFISTKDGNIHAIKINKDGSFDKLSHQKTFVGQNISSSPVTFNGRIYLGNGGIGTSAPFTVIDAKTLTKIYDIPIITQSSPIITTAYANDQNKNTVYIYVVSYGGYNNATASYDPNKIYAIKDFEGNTTPSFEIIAETSTPQFCSSSITVDSQGTIYLTNDSNTLFAYKNTTDTSITAKEIETTIQRIPNPENISKLYKTDINRARARYNSLNSKDKQNVSNILKLEQLENKLYELESEIVSVNDLIEKIDSLPQNITISQKDLVFELWAMYQSLSQQEKALVTNFEKLKLAKQKIDQIISEITVELVIERITQMPDADTVSLDEKDNVLEIFTLYSSLTDDDKTKVTNSQKLIDSKLKVEQIEKYVDYINKTIWEGLNPENITLNDKIIVNQIIEMYSMLSENDRKYIENYDDVLTAKEKINQLELQQNNKNDNPPTSEKLLLVILTIILISLSSTTVIVAIKDKLNNKNEVK